MSAAKIIQQNKKNIELLSSFSLLSDVKKSCISVGFLKLERRQARLASSGGPMLSGGLLTYALLSCYSSCFQIQRFVQIHAHVKTIQTKKLKHW